MLIYRLFISLAAPFLAIAFAWKALRKTEPSWALKERLGRGNDSVASRVVLWLHGASIGEIKSAKAFIEATLAADPKTEFVVTSNSLTAREMVANWRNPRISARLAPLDYRFATSNFLNEWQPKAHLFLEKEIWPNRFMLCKSAAIPIIGVSTALSQGSARNWQRFKGLQSRVFGAINWISPQDQASADRLLAAGVPELRIGPMLNFKTDVKMESAPAAEISRLRQYLPRDLTVLAASTHVREEEIILRAFKTAALKVKGLRLVIAPRHPSRGAEVAKLAAKAGLETKLRSLGQDPTTDVFIADTLGEMALWYQLAGITFVGGSLIQKGGHTPFEPVQFKTCILHGPHVENHAEAFAALAAADAAIATRGAQELSQAIVRLAADSSARDQMAQNAINALSPMQADSAGLKALFANFSRLTGLHSLVP